MKCAVVKNIVSKPLYFTASGSVHSCLAKLCNVFLFPGLFSHMWFEILLQSSLSWWVSSCYWTLHSVCVCRVFMGLWVDHGLTTVEFNLTWLPSCFIQSHLSYFFTCYSCCRPVFLGYRLAVIYNIIFFLTNRTHCSTYVLFLFCVVFVQFGGFNQPNLPLFLVSAVFSMWFVCHLHQPFVL